MPDPLVVPGAPGVPGAEEEAAWEKARRDPVVLEKIMRAALRDGDVKGVAAALTLLALADPQRAELLRDTLLVGIALAEQR